MLALSAEPVSRGQATRSSAMIAVNKSKRERKEKKRGEQNSIHSLGRSNIADYVMFYVFYAFSAQNFVLSNDKYEGRYLLKRSFAAHRIQLIITQEKRKEIR